MYQENKIRKLDLKVISPITTTHSSAYDFSFDYLLFYTTVWTKQQGIRDMRRIVLLFLISHFFMALIHTLDKNRRNKKINKMKRGRGWFNTLWINLASFLFLSDFLMYFRVAFQFGSNFDWTCYERKFKSPSITITISLSSLAPFAPLPRTEIKLPSNHAIYF